MIITNNSSSLAQNRIQFKARFANDNVTKKILTKAVQQGAAEEVFYVQEALAKVKSDAKIALKENPIRGLCTKVISAINLDRNVETLMQGNYSPYDIIEAEAMKFMAKMMDNSSTDGRFKYLFDFNQELPITRKQARQILDKKACLSDVAEDIKNLKEENVQLKMQIEGNEFKIKNKQTHYDQHSADIVKGFINYEL